MTYRILIIDDNAHHAELAARRLMKEGWEVFTTDRPDVTDDLRSYDLILLDYNMPKRSGLDVLKGMKDLDITTPVIFLTGHGNEVIASETIKQGAYDYVVKDTPLLYLERLPAIIREAKSKHELIETNRFLIQELKRANERLQKMTFTDEMTNLYNYRFMKKQLETEIQRSSRYEKPLSVCLIDLDNFKEINDRFGHQAGDDALRQIAHILSETVRSVDFVGRYGGDEFLILFPDTPLNDAFRLCERIRKTIAENPLRFQGTQLPVTLSIGVADFDPRKRKTPEALIEAADQCLYRAKREGRNKVVAASLIRVVDKRDSEAAAQV